MNDHPTRSHFRERLSRVYELKDMVADPAHPDAYFQDFEDGLAEYKSKLNAFLKLERQLAVLDAEAWSDLRGRAALELQRRRPGRGWQQLFNVFSEARAFGYLVSIGCTDIHFIKRTHGKTPDIAALRAGVPVFCEVKTINVSDDEAERRRRISDVGFAASKTSVHLRPNFSTSCRQRCKSASDSSMPSTLSAQRNASSSSSCISTTGSATTSPSISRIWMTTCCRTRLRARSSCSAQGPTCSSATSQCDRRPPSRNSRSPEDTTTIRSRTFASYPGMVTTGTGVSCSMSQIAAWALNPSLTFWAHSGARLPSSFRGLQRLMILIAL